MTAQVHGLVPSTTPAAAAARVYRHTAPRTAPALARRERWQRAYHRRLVMVDLAVVLFSVGLAGWIQIAVIADVHLSDLKSAPWQYLRVAMLMCVVWLVSLAWLQTRAHKLIGQGTMEYRRVVNATALAFGVAAIGFVIMQSQGIRTQLLIALPVGVVGLLVGRWSSRRWLVRRRATGGYLSRALVVGTRRDAAYVIDALHDGGVTGYEVVGVVLDDASADEGELTIDGHPIAAYRGFDAAATIAEQLECDAVVVASTHQDDPGYVKRLSWQLEGTAAELVLSSPLADVAGPRMALKPIEGLPLIQVEIPTFEGGRYVTKRTMDILISALALIGIAVMTPLIAIAIKLDSPGPVFFSQDRVGRDGVRFRMFKFRSMTVDADARRSALHAQNEGSGPLFKIRDDPRVTQVGAFLRKFSIDELPQFWNVLVGDMSIVGPRPPLPSEVSTYEGMVHRRLYIRPGITGLWQISGRSDLTWDESVQLDLRYVENWSVMFDLKIVLRTPHAVVRSHGAY
jgi:exopolysaccharide biosynthesis polyprenyl glycosylphosphotransferase